MEVFQDKTAWGKRELVTIVQSFFLKKNGGTGIPVDADALGGCSDDESFLRLVSLVRINIRPCEISVGLNAHFIPINSIPRYRIQDR